VRYVARNGTDYVEFARGSTNTRDDGNYRLFSARRGGTVVDFSGSSQISFYNRTVSVDQRRTTRGTSLARCASRVRVEPDVAGGGG
jgi:hypothetical protein